MPTSQQTLALELRNKGKLTHAAIGARLGVSRSTIRRWGNPQVAERNRVLSSKRRRERWDADFRHRCSSALKNSAWYAHKCGYAPCTASVEELEQSFTGLCGICGRHEAELSGRLVVDHCHATGGFSRLAVPKM